MKDRQAIVATIKHWREDYKNIILFGGTEAFSEVFAANKCPLCGRHLCKGSIDDDICGQCPLDKVHHKHRDGCAPITAPWQRARKAARKGNKPAFMAARATLLKRLYRARAALDRAGVE